MSQELQVLEMVIRRLDEGKIPYMVTGSIAANLYAVPRMTRDIDIVVEIRNEDVDRLLALFEKDCYADRDSIAQAVERRAIFNVIHNASVLKIDLIVRKDSPYRKLEFERRRRVEVAGVPLWVVSPEDLILSKLHWAKDSASEMQIGDVRNLLRTVKDLDMAYLEKWIEEMGLQALYRKAKP